MIHVRSPALVQGGASFSLSLSLSLCLSLSRNGLDTSYEGTMATIPHPLRLALSQMLPSSPFMLQWKTIEPLTLIVNARPLIAHFLLCLLPSRCYFQQIDACMQEEYMETHAARNIFKRHLSYLGSSMEVQPQYQ